MTTEIGSAHHGTEAVATALGPYAVATFTDRSDGNVSLAVGGGDVAAARARGLARVGATLGEAVFMEQVHSSGVARVGGDERGRGVDDGATTIPGVDALVTEASDVALCVMVADCVPVLLARDDGPVAAVHAGRRGVEAGVVSATVEALRTGSTAARVLALVGPAIGGCCYEVPADMASNLVGLVPEAVATTMWGAPALDLPAAVEAQLRAAGVAEIRRDGRCTRCHADRWFSHRADGEDAERAGRQLGVVVRVPGVPAELAAPGFLD